MSLVPMMKEWRSGEEKTWRCLSGNSSQINISVNLKLKMHHNRSLFFLSARKLSGERQIGLASSPSTIRA